MSTDTAEPKVIAPGATLGVLGGGQLGRMFAIAARRLGYRVGVFAPEEESPAGQIADFHDRAPYDDLDAVRAFAKKVDVVTFEFENVLSATTEAASEVVPVRPAGSLLHTTQHRIREKRGLSERGIPVAPFVAIEHPQGGRLDDAGFRELLKGFSFPAILKTAAFGYDGKGQKRVASLDEAVAAWHDLDQQEVVVEGLVDFVREFSIVGARSMRGDIALFPPTANDHANHILDVSICPAPISLLVAARAKELVEKVFESFGVVGVLCVELFELASGEILVNELAPRPHNSGHLTIEGCVTDQFEQQVRAVCGLPLGDPALRQPTAMANLLGDLWKDGEPWFDEALRVPGVRLHLYGKSQAKPGRKMGHLTACAEDPMTAQERVLEARARLTGRDSGD